MFLSADFVSQGLIDFALALSRRVIPKAVIAVAIIIPARMVQNGVETDSVQVDAGTPRSIGFFTNISKPGRPLRVFSSGFGNEHGPAVASIHFFENLPVDLIVIDRQHF